MKCILTNKGMPNLEDGSSSKNSIITHTATTDPSIDHTPVREWLEYVRDGVAKVGSDLNGETKLREKMEAARFINIEDQVYAARSEHGRRKERSNLPDYTGGWQYRMV